MSRAINIQATEAEVIAMCARHGVTISAIERLLDSGTRVVMMNTQDTATITRAFGSKVMDGAARRVPVFTRQR